MEFFFDCLSIFNLKIPNPKCLEIENFPQILDFKVFGVSDFWIRGAQLVIAHYYYLYKRSKFWQMAQ